MSVQDNTNPANDKNATTSGQPDNTPTPAYDHIADQAQSIIASQLPNVLALANKLHTNPEHHDKFNQNSVDVARRPTGWEVPNGMDVSHGPATISVTRSHQIPITGSETPTYEERMAKQEAEICRICAARESGTVEFKQSLEYVDAAGFANVPEAQRSQRIAETQKNVVHSALKTICAFLNSRGGTLLLGVHDRGDIIGIEPDYTLCGKKQDVDGFELKLNALLKTRMQPLPANLEVNFVVVDGKTVCRIDVPTNSRAHYLDNKLYIRLGNSTEELTGRDLADWLQQRPHHAGGSSQG